MYLGDVLGSAGFIYVQCDNSLVLVVTRRLSHADLQLALPLTNCDGKTHVVAHFVGGTDYVGAATEDELRQQIAYFNMISIDDAAVYDLGTRSEVQTLIDFGRAQQLGSCVD